MASSSFRCPFNYAPRTRIKNLLIYFFERFIIFLKDKNKYIFEHVIFNVDCQNWYCMCLLDVSSDDLISFVVHVVCDQH